MPPIYLHTDPFFDKEGACYAADVRKALAEADEKIRKLQDFKDFVHRRLDEMGIEKEPNGKHSAEGCRVGDRLDIVQEQIKLSSELQDDIRRLRIALGWYADDNNWKEQETGVGMLPSLADNDSGNCARVALL